MTTSSEADAPRRSNEPATGESFARAGRIACGFDAARNAAGSKPTALPGRIDLTTFTAANRSAAARAMVVDGALGVDDDLEEFLEGEQAATIMIATSTQTKTRERLTDPSRCPEK